MLLPSSLSMRHRTVHALRDASCQGAKPHQSATPMKSTHPAPRTKFVWPLRFMDGGISHGQIPASWQECGARGAGGHVLIRASGTPDALKVPKTSKTADHLSPDTIKQADDLCNIELPSWDCGCIRLGPEITLPSNFIPTARLTTALGRQPLPMAPDFARTVACLPPRSTRQGLGPKHFRQVEFRLRNCNHGACRGTIVLQEVLSRAIFSCSNHGRHCCRALPRRAS